MAKLFEITDDIRQIARDGLSDLLDQLGRSCLLVYPPKMVECGCGSDPVGQKGANRWVTGAPFRGPEAGVCPDCGGQGFRAEEVTATVKMLVQWEPANFYRKFPAGVQVPDGTLQTKSYQVDGPKILQARHMILSPDKQGLIRWRYELDGEPFDVSSINPGYFLFYQWKRVG